MNQIVVKQGISSRAKEVAEKVIFAVENEPQG
jgi:hypothetical protein